MQRLGMMSRLKPEKAERYIELHAATWPGVLDRNTACNIQNFSIFHKVIPGGEHWVFGYLEYTGDNLEADMQRMAADPEVQRWWDECKPCFDPVEELPPGEVWSPMESIFFQA